MTATTSERVAAAPAAYTRQFVSRIESVDVVRGLVMILMALDHTRDYFGVGANPTDLSTTTVGLFLTRWITHFCAPTFFLLTGVGAALALRTKTRTELARFLFTRGLWLIFLEAVVIRSLAYQFNFDFRVTLLIVIWALGWSMIALSALLFLPTLAIATFGAVLVAGHNLLDGVRSANPLWAILHGPGFVLNTPDHVVFATYPLIPWIGVTALGFVLGGIYSWDAERRRAFLLRLGLALPIAFVVLRAINVYGDPSPWSTQPTAVMTVLSFINTTKYSPSLLFLLMTLGVTLLALRAFDGGVPRLFKPALTIGKVPLFYFVLHFSLIHLLAVIVTQVRYGTAHWMFESPTLDRYPFTPPPGWGYSLAVVYGVWVLVVLLMYPACAWYAGVKSRSRSKWLSYL
jgi:uncharacterized membrane protein